MYKRILEAVAAFAFSVCIVAGSLYIFQISLRNGERSMLSEGGIAASNSLYDYRPGGEAGVSASYVETDIRLSEDEIYHILKNREEAVTYQPHEPYYGQLTMEQAVEKGEEWLKLFKEENPALLLPDNLGGRVWANLARPGSENIPVIDSSRILSFWILHYYAAGAAVELEMNAVTGEILDMTIRVENVEDILGQEDRERMLETFTEQFSFAKKGKIQKEGETLIKALAGKKFYAVELSEFGRENYDESWCYYRLTLVLEKPVSRINRSETSY